MTSLSGAEVALCVVAPMLAASLALLLVCHCSHRRLCCFSHRPLEDQALLSISSHKSSTNNTNQQHQHQLTNCHDDQQQKHNNSEKNEYSITNPSYNGVHQVVHHEAALQRSTDPAPTRSVSLLSIQHHPHHNQQNSASAEKPGARKASSPASLLPPPAADHLMIPMSDDHHQQQQQRQPDDSLLTPGGGGYLTLSGGGDLSGQASRRSSMEIINPENGKNLLYSGRRRSSMQVPIDIRSIDPRLYGSTKPASFDCDGMDDTDRPILHLSICYCSDNEELQVKLIQARNLEAVDGSAIRNPYCSVELMPDYVVHHSKVHHGTCDPEFEELFRFPLLQEEIDDKTLRIKVFESDQFARDECSGSMELKLKEIDFELMSESSSHLDMWRTVQRLPSGASNEAKTGGAGDLMVALSYLPSAEKLTVTLQRARNLQLANGDGGRKPVQDVYVKASLYKAGVRIKKKKTQPVQVPVHGAAPSGANGGGAGAHPVFDEALTFGITHQQLRSRDVKVVCQVMHDGKLVGQRRTVIGWLELSPTSDNAEERQHWCELASSLRSHNQLAPLARWHPLRRRGDTSSSSDS